MAYQPNNWNPLDIITSEKLNDIEQGLLKASENNIFGHGGAEQPSDGIHSFIVTNKGDAMPSHPQPGDTVFIKDGDDYTMVEWNGEEWAVRLDPKLSERIDKVLDDAKTQSEQLISDNNVEINETIDTVAQEKIDLAIKDADFNENAQAMADKALADAKANTAQVAQEALNSANQNLSAAKTDLTNSIASEASARNAAVAAANSQAQTYANQAKSDALNTIAKEVTDRQNAVSALDTKATNAVNQAKSDINDTINAISVGGRNYILNSKHALSSQVDAMDTGWVNTSIPISALSNTVFTISVQVDYDNVTAVTGGNRIGAEIIAIEVKPDGSNKTRYFGTWRNAKVGESFHGMVSETFDMRGVVLKSVYSANHFGGGLYISGITATNVSVSNPKIEMGNTATDYTQAPEDVVLDYTTKDNQIKETITQYQTTNDGKVTKAQTDATTALGQVATKVSQTEYNTKTGDLDSKYTTVKQTADSQATDIVNIKATATSQASKINSISSDVDGTKQSISDIETTQDSQSDKINQITSDVNGTKQSITDIQTKDGKQDTRMGTIETSVSGVKSDFSSYKTTNDGVVKTAQTTAQTAVDGLKNKVSQSDYDQKTGQLQTDLTTTTQTANKATTDIVSIKQKDGDQDSRMTQIESDASGVKTTVSDLKTEQGKQSGYISTLQQRADGWDATVTKVDNLSVGGRNLLLNSKTLSWGIGNNTATTSTKVSYDDTTNMWHITSPKGGSGNAGIYFSQTNNVSNAITAGQQWAFSFDIKGTGVYSQFGIEWSSPFNKLSGNVPTDWTRVSSTGTTAGTGAKSVIIYFDSTNVALDVYIKLPKLETGNLPTDWSPAPEDLSGATAKAQLTADNATLSINNYKTDADGRISKAQADIQANANAITTKVSQTDYDKKTGDLSTKVNTAQSTADSATSTIGAYKTSNDARVASAESKITANANAITQKVSQTDYNQKTGELSGSISTLKQRADGFDTTVTKFNNLAIGSRNYFLNSSGSSLEGWSQTDGWSIITGTYRGSVFSIKPTSAWTSGNHNSLYKTGLIIPSGTEVTVSFWAKADIAGAKFHSEPNGSYASYNTVLTTDWARYSYTFTLTSTTIYFMGVDAGKTYYLDDIKLEIGNVATDWTPAPEDTDNKISTVSQTVDSISSIVSDPTTGLTKRVQTAEGTLSQVTGTDIPALQNATFWQHYSSLNFNDYTRQGSFFFNTTAAKTNGPTTSNGWLYLIVEQGTADNSRIKQTAWYDGVNGVKITYVRTLNSGTWSPWYANDNDSVTTISQTNSSITREIADRKTGDNNTLQSSKDFTTSSITSYDNGIQSTITQTANGILAQVGATNLFPNSEFEKDYGYNKKDGNTVLSLGTKSNIDGAYNGTVSVTSTDTAWRGYWANNIQVQGGQKYSASVKVHYTNGGLTAGKAFLDLWFIDSTGARISTATVSTPQVSSPYWVQLISEGFTAPTNAVYLQMSLIVNNAGAGQVATFTQPMLTATEKLQSYTPNDDVTTQLALLKDKWSIGIADNIGNITSGIVGNASQMSLISKKVVIDSPSTQITGAAWINSAMIQNGSIINANIADAAITSAKIATLDVSKISGDITSFVKSGWNNAYGSNVTIDGDGMVVSYGNTSTSFENGQVLFKQLADYADGSNQVETIGSISTTHNGTVNNLIIGLYDQTHIPFSSTNGTRLGSPDGEIYGGDLVAIGKANNFTGGFDNMFSYSNQTASKYYGITEGFNFRDKVNFNSNEIVSGSVNYNLKIGALKFSGKFDGKYVPVIVATWSGYIGGGIAFGNDNVVAFNQTKATIL